MPRRHNLMIQLPAMKVMVQLLQKDLANMQTPCSALGSHQLRGGTQAALNRLQLGLLLGACQRNSKPAASGRGHRSLRICYAATTCVSMRYMMWATRNRCMWHASENSYMG